MRLRQDHIKAVSRHQFSRKKFSTSGRRSRTVCSSFTRPGYPGKRGGATWKYTEFYGASNTTLVVELAGRNHLLREGIEIPTTDSESLYNSCLGGGAWVDPLNGNLEVAGRLFDGTNTVGACAINCSNARTAEVSGKFSKFGAGLYSFHTGGAMALMGDGAVLFLNENISGITLFGIMSRDGSETLGEF